MATTVNDRAASTFTYRANFQSARPYKAVGDFRTQTFISIAI